MRFACTGLVQCMTCDAAGAFCIAALSDKINLWEVRARTRTCNHGNRRSLT